MEVFRRRGADTSSPVATSVYLKRNVIRTQQKIIVKLSQTLRIFLIKNRLLSLRNSIFYI